MSTAPPPKQIRFVHNQGQPPSKRRRINAACLTCRKRKTRCAGERPVCSTCTKNGHECLGYTDLPDKKQGDGASDRLKRAQDGPTDGYPDDGEEDGIAELASEEDMKPPKIHVRDEVNSSTAATKMLSPPLPPQPRKTSSSVRHLDRRSKSQETVPRLPSSSRRRTSDNDPKDRNVHPLPPTFPRTSASEERRSAGSHSPTLHFKDKMESHRVPYFRYFGPTAIVPGYKQMVVSVRERRRSNGGSASATSPSSAGVGQVRSLASAASQAGSEAVIEELPVYDVNDQGPVPRLVLHLVKVFFAHLGCNYPFLKEGRFTRMVQEKRVEPILVDAVCALAARFSDSPQIAHDGKAPRSEFGQQYAQRAKAATVDTFPAPSVGAVQALLMMAYEGFGANQDSALWMYLGLAIRMAVDLGLQKVVGVKYQGERDPWYVRHWARGSSEAGQSEHPVEEDGISREQELEVEQERMDTFWAVFVLDRVISSGTGRPVTFRDDDFEFDLPLPAVDPATGWPNPFPTFVRIIHLYGRASDVLNNIRDAKDLTRDKWSKLSQMENELTRLYQKQDPRLHFNVGNFKAYLSTGQSTTFILMHFWFHALIIILHQPTLLSTFGSLSRAHQLLPNSRELSMSSAKTIADILSFAELIGPTSFIGNPFTSQPMYIAACAFLMESASMASQPTSREHTPPEGVMETSKPDKNARNSTDGGGKFSSKHSLLASAANQNYSRCYNSLQQLHAYWGGVKYILTALDQKSKGIWDCETYTNEEYESTKTPSMRRESLATFRQFEHSHPASPNIPPFAWSITGATNSPNSSLTLMYQNMQSGVSQPPQTPGQQRNRNSVSSPGNMVYDPIRQTQPETQVSMYAAFPQHPINAHRQPPQGRGQRLQGPSAVRQTSRLIRPPIVPDDHTESLLLHRNPPVTHELTMAPPQQLASLASPVFPSAQQQTRFNAFSATTPNAAMSGETPGSGQSAHAVPVGMGQAGADMFDPTFGTGAYSFMDQNMGPIGDVVTYENPIDLGSLGLTNDMMPQWLEYLPSDVLGMFEGGSGMNEDGGNGDGS